MISVTGEPGRDGVRVGVSLIDHATGMYAAFAILAALHAGRRRDARRLALGDGAVVRLVPPDRHARDRVPCRPAHGTAFHAIAPYQVFPTEEGGLMITAANDGIFRRLAEALGAPELADDPRFATNPDRVANREALAEALSARLRRTPAPPGSRSSPPPASRRRRCRTCGEVAADPQLEAIGILQRSAT